MSQEDNSNNVQVRYSYKQQVEVYEDVSVPVFAYVYISIQEFQLLLSRD